MHDSCIRFQERKKSAGHGTFPLNSSELGFVNFDVHGSNHSQKPLSKVKGQYVNYRGTFPQSNFCLRANKIRHLSQNLGSFFLELPLKLTDFASFIATSFKVPLMVETSAPVPDLQIQAGTYSARQLLDAAVAQLPRFKWKDEEGIAHIYQTGLVKSPGNLLSFHFPMTWGSLCTISAPVSVPSSRGTDVEAASTLDFGGRDFNRADCRWDKTSTPCLPGTSCWLLAFESIEPNLKSQFPFRNWFAEALEVAEPSPIWVQTPKPHGR
jgi:hypothetical protein